MRVMILLGVAGWVLAGESTAQDASAPPFDPSVFEPAYAGRVQGPSVLVDEGHFNMQTPRGSYRSFVDLVRHDGYQVTINTDPFDEETLAEHDILVIVSPQPFPDSLVRWSERSLRTPVGRSPRSPRES